MAFVQIGTAGGGEGNYVGRGLGALSRTGITIDYYPSGGLVWKDKNLKALHDALVDFDFKWQSTLSKLAAPAGAIAPLLKLKAEDVVAAAKLPCPLAGAALLLELAAGGRVLDQSIIAMVRLLATTLIAESALMGLLAAYLGGIAAAGAVAGTAGTGGALLAILGPAGAALIPAAGSFAAAAGVGALVGNMLLSLTEGKLPDRSSFGTSLKLAAAASGKPVPDEAAINAAFGGLGAAISAGGKALASSSVTADKDWQAKVQTTAQALKKQPTFARLPAARLQEMAIQAVTKKFGKRPKIVQPPAAPNVDPSNRRAVTSRGSNNTLLIAGGVGLLGIAALAFRGK